MNQLVAFWKSIKWVLLLVLGAIVSVLVLLLTKHKPAEGNSAFTPPTPLQEKIEKAEEAALVAKASAKAVDDAKQAQLKTIAAVEDGAERRKQLADFLRTV